MLMSSSSTALYGELLYANIQLLEGLVNMIYLQYLCINFQVSKRQFRREPSQNGSTHI